ncbi:MAG: hypothetical protein K6U87_14385 [Firmicutes bacterium]|nr:hypothetical protein [Bacillota bacterium]
MEPPKARVLALKILVELGGAAIIIDIATVACRQLPGENAAAVIARIRAALEELERDGVVRIHGQSVVLSPPC